MDVCLAIGLAEFENPIEGDQRGSVSPRDAPTFQSSIEKPFPAWQHRPTADNANNEERYAELFALTRCMSLSLH